jgi:hypothetical protein
MECTTKEQETCRVEKLGCKGCYYEKPIAKGDRTYCIKECENKCSRHADNYIFLNGVFSYTNECIKEENK